MSTIVQAPSDDRRRAYADRMAQLVERARTSHEAFAALVMKDNRNLPIDLEPFHLLIIRFIRYCWSRQLYAGILAPWRHGKSLAGTDLFSLVEIGRNPNVRIRLIAGHDHEAVKRVSSIRRHLVSQEYRWVYPEIRPAKLSEFSMRSLFVERSAPGPDPTLSAAGVFSGEAGGGYDVLMFDDVATHQNMILKPALRPRVYETLTSVWLRRVDPSTRVLWVGTVWHADDPSHMFRADTSGQWLWLIIRINRERDGLDVSTEPSRVMSVLGTEK